MGVTLESILALAEEARRSPHARRVLFDAMTERYGRAFERVVDSARANFPPGTAIAVLLDPEALALAEREVTWGTVPKWRGPQEHVLQAAVWTSAVASERASRRFYRRRPDLQTALTGSGVTIVVVRSGGLGR